MLPKIKAGAKNTMMNSYKIIKLMGVQQGVSAATGREWKRRDVVVESQERVMYPDVIVATVKGEAVDKFAYKEGEVVELGLSFYAHEHNGRWYNDVTVREF